MGGFANKSQVGEITKTDLDERKEIITREIASLQKDHENLKVALSTSDEVYAQVETAKIALKEANDRVDAANAKVNEIETSIEALKGTHGDIKAQTEALLTSKLEAAVAYEKALSVKNAIETTIEGLNRTKIGLDVTIGALEIAITDKEEKLKKLEATIAEKTVVIGDLETKKTSLISDIMNQKSDYDTRTIKVEGLKTEEATLITNVADLQIKMTQFANGLDSGSQALAKVQATLEADYKEKLLAIEVREGACSTKEAFLDKRTQTLRDAKIGMEDFFGKKLPNIII